MQGTSTASCSAVHGVGAWDMGGTRTALSADGARGARGGGARGEARGAGARRGCVDTMNDTMSENLRDASAAGGERGGNVECSSCSAAF